MNGLREFTMNASGPTGRVALSYPLSEGTPYPTGGQPVQISAVSRLAKADISNTSAVRFWNHAGTHIDGPAHMLADKGPLTDYVPPTGFFFSNPLLLDVPCEDDTLLTAIHLDRASPLPSDCDLLLLRTGFSRYRKEDPHRFQTSNPGLDASAARRILDRCPHVRCVGIDSISFAAMKHLNEGIAAHKMFFGRQEPVLLLEDLNLNHDLSALQSVWVIPLFIEGLDSCPCTIIAELEQ